MGTTAVHYIFNDVQLQEGTNTIEARAKTKGKEYTDTIEWSYSKGAGGSGEGLGKEGIGKELPPKSSSSTKEHVGL